MSRDGYSAAALPVVLHLGRYILFRPVRTSLGSVLTFWSGREGYSMLTINTYVRMIRSWGKFYGRFYPAADKRYRLRQREGYAQQHVLGVVILHS